MEGDVSIYIIKPEAIPFSDKIHKMIISVDLTILTFKQTILSPNLVDNLYIDCPKEIVEATKYFMNKNICEIGIVNGKNAVQKLIDVCGSETNPNNCRNGTIRNLYGIHELQFYMGTGYFKNAIHRPKTKKEMEMDLALLNDIVKS